MTSQLASLSAVEIAGLVRRGALSAREVVSAHLEQIQERNAAVNAIVTLDEDGALRQADEADSRLRHGEEIGPLHGLPVAFKDTGNTAGMRTTFGHPAFADNIPRVDDPNIGRILRSGAIRVGKTNVPEFAAGSHTFNRVFGATRNPYDLSRSAGGSSGGSCAALAARLVPLADGSDMGGSLRNPASFCNVVGLRPTPGVVPGEGQANVFGALGTAGPLGRSVRDLALLFSVMARPSALDVTSRPIDAGALAGLQPQRIDGLRVAYAPDLGGRVPVEPEVARVVERFAGLLASLGARVEHACPDLDGADETFRTLRAAEFDLLWGEQLRTGELEFTHFLAQNIREGAALTGRDVARASAEMTRLTRSAARFFESYDLVLSPVSQVAPFPVEREYPHTVNGVAMRDYLDWMRAAYLYTPLRIPGLSLPAGFTSDGLPVGVQLLTAAGTDVELLRIAVTLEEAAAVPQDDPFEVASPADAARHAGAAVPAVPGPIDSDGTEAGR